MCSEWSKLCVGGGKNDLWDSFCSWASASGIGTSEEDWRPWWNCFNAGAEVKQAILSGKLLTIVNRTRAELDALTP